MARPNKVYIFHRKTILRRLGLKRIFLAYRIGVVGVIVADMSSPHSSILYTRIRLELWGRFRDDY